MYLRKEVFFGLRHRYRGKAMKTKQHSNLKALMAMLLLARLASAGILNDLVARGILSTATCYGVFDPVTSSQTNNCKAGFCCDTNGNVNYM